MLGTEFVPAAAAAAAAASNSPSYSYSSMSSGPESAGAFSPAYDASAQRIAHRDTPPLDSMGDAKGTPSSYQVVNDLIFIKENWSVESGFCLSLEFYKGQVILLKLAKSKKLHFALI